MVILCGPKKLKESMRYFPHVYFRRSCSRDASSTWHQSACFLRGGTECHHFLFQVASRFQLGIRFRLGVLPCHYHQQRWTRPAAQARFSANSFLLRVKRLSVWVNPLMRQFAHFSVVSKSPVTFVLFPKFCARRT